MSRPENRDSPSCDCFPYLITIRVDSAIEVVSGAGWPLVYEDGYSQLNTRGGGSPTISLHGKFLGGRRVPQSSSMDTGGQGDGF